MKKLFLGILVVLGLVVVAGYFLPKDWHIERSIVMAAEPAAIYAQVADLETWPQWTAWNKQLDPAGNWEYSGAESGVGARTDWSGPKLGSGNLTITAADPRSGIAYDLQFEDYPMARGGLRFEEDAGGTKVTWTGDGQGGGGALGFVSGWMASLGLIQKMIAKDFETGLAGLKARVEAPR